MTAVRFTEIPAPSSILRLSPACKAYVTPEKCSVFVAREPVIERGIELLRWHLSIAHPSRNPRWREIHAARYQLVPLDITMAMLFPPLSQYVNEHEYCFHLWEIENEEYRHNETR